MPAVRETSIRLTHQTGREAGALLVRLRPGVDESRTPAPLLLEPSSEELESVQLLEGQEYRYTVQGIEPQIRIEPSELFFPDDQDGLQGSLRPGLSTGRVPVLVSSDNVEVARGVFEVRARKLDYLRHYRWMLRDIAELMTEVVMERFAASELKFAPDEARDAATLYQRFEFLRALLTSEDFEGAIGRVIASPYVVWMETTESRSPRRGVRHDSGLGSSLLASLERNAWPFRPQVNSLADRPTSDGSHHRQSAQPIREVRDNAMERCRPSGRAGITASGGICPGSTWLARCRSAFTTT
jgi:hypothetical protein